MNTALSHETLTAYILGELTGEELRAVEKALEEDSEARAAAEELRGTARQVQSAFAQEPVLALRSEQYAKLQSFRRTVRTAWRERGRFSRGQWARLAGAAAVVVFIAALFVPTAGRMREKAGMRPSASSPAIDAMGRRNMLGSPAMGYDYDLNGNGVLEEAPFGRAEFESLDYMGERITESGGAEPAPEAPVPGLQLEERSRPDRYLIKNAALVIEVEDARAAADVLTAAVQEAEGYISNHQERMDGLGHRYITMQVRVPASKLDAALLRLEPLGKVLNKQVSTEDVTEEFVDTDARVRNLKKTEERLLSHLDSSDKLKDVLDVEEELSKNREKIERLEGRLKFLSHRVAYSTIQVTLQEKPAAEPMTPQDSYSSAQVFSEAARSLLGFLRAIWTRTIWLAVWSPVGLVLAAVAWLVYRRVRREWM